MYGLASTSKVVKGSVADVAAFHNKSLVDVVMDIKAIVMLDISRSMDVYDAPVGTRFDYALTKLEEIQEKFPGQIALLCFNDKVTFCPNGIPNMLPDHTTNMLAALQEIKIADEVMDISKILISDGEPDFHIREQTMEYARGFKSKIDVIYIGPEGGYGEDYLRQLAGVTGGAFHVNATGNMLGQTITKMLEDKHDI